MRGAESPFIIALEAHCNVTDDLSTTNAALKTHPILMDILQHGHTFHQTLPPCQASILMPRDLRICISARLIPCLSQSACFQEVREYKLSAQTKGPTLEDLLELGHTYPWERRLLDLECIYLKLEL